MMCGVLIKHMWACLCGTRSAFESVGWLKIVLHSSQNTNTGSIPYHPVMIWIKSMEKGRFTLPQSWDIPVSSLNPQCSCYLDCRLWVRTETLPQLGSQAQLFWDVSFIILSASAKSSQSLSTQLSFYIHISPTGPCSLESPYWYTELVFHEGVLFYFILPH